MADKCCYAVEVVNCGDEPPASVPPDSEPLGTGKVAFLLSPLALIIVRDKIYEYVKISMGWSTFPWLS